MRPHRRLDDHRLAQHGPLFASAALTRSRPHVVLIDEPNCIGCALCLKVCPTDAIVGAPRRMHTVIAADCTGCDKCIPVCPTDCIAPAPRPAEAVTRVQLAARWRRRIQARRARLDAEARAAAEARRRLRAALP